MQEGNKRIAKNTIIIYIRLGVTIIVGLLTSRYVLQALGASDFGLYNVVAGVLAMLSFISASMTTTTTRFINFEEGKKDGDTNLIFNVCQNIHVIVAIAIFVLAETIGLWYINNYLNVEPGKEADANFCFQISTIVACIGLVNVPYQGLLMAKEEFSKIAIVEIGNSLLKLVLVLTLFLFKENTLRAYAIYMSLMTFVSFIAYHWICYKKWPEIVKINIGKAKGHYKEIVAYNGYNVLSSASITARDQGSNMIINFFFGTTVNAAYAIARIIQTYVITFTSNFDVAAAPQMTQNISAGDGAKSERLAGTLGRMCMLMMELAVFPLFVELDFILKLWLGDVPDGTLLFSQLILLLVFVSSTSAGMGQFINASGKIKWFKIEMAVLYLLVLPISIVLFNKGAAPSTIVILFIISDIFNRIIQLYLMKRILGFDSMQFVKMAYYKPVLVALIMCLITFLQERFMPSGIFFSILNIILSLVFVISLILAIGVSKQERITIWASIKDKMIRK
jgi:O-antigen/teichoic acid export membrane protein